MEIDYSSLFTPPKCVFLPPETPIKEQLDRGVQSVHPAFIGEDEDDHS
jgi:hypothetical protein